MSWAYRDAVAWASACDRVVVCDGCGVLVARDWPRGHACFPDDDDDEDEW